MARPPDEEIQARYWPAFLRSRRLMALFDAVRDRWNDRVQREHFAHWEHPERARRLLIVRTRGLGDVLQVSVLLDRIRKRYGAERLDFATSPEGAVVLAADTRVDEIFPARDLNGERLGQYDLVMNFHIFDNSPEVRQALAGAGCGRLLGRTYGDGVNYDWLACAPRGWWLRTYAMMADVPSFPDDPLRINIQRRQGWEEAQRECLSRLVPDAGENLVGLCLGGENWRRNYPLPFLGKLIELVARKYRPVVVGLSSGRPTRERALIEPVMRAHPEAVNLIDRLKMEELLYVMDACRAFVTCDTGPLHLAIGLGTPVVALFGNGPPQWVFGPELQSGKHSAIVTSSPCVACRYRFRRECLDARQAKCMDKFDMVTVGTELDRLVRAASG